MQAALIPKKGCLAQEAPIKKIKIFKKKEYERGTSIITGGSTGTTPRSTWKVRHVRRGQNSITRRKEELQGEGKGEKNRMVGGGSGEKKKGGGGWKGELR